MSALLVALLQGCGGEERAPRPPPMRHLYGDVDDCADVEHLYESADRMSERLAAYDRWQVLQCDGPAGGQGLGGSAGSGEGARQRGQVAADRVASGSGVAGQRPI